MIGDRRKRRPSGHARADRVNSEPTRVVPQFECAAAANTTKVSAGATQMSHADPWKIQAQAMLLNSHELSSAEWRSRPVVRALRRVAPAAEALSAADQAAYDALRRESDELEAEYEGADELPDAVDARLGEFEKPLARFEDRAVRFDPEVIARGGAFVSLDASGAPKIERGFVRPEDLASAPAQEPSLDTEAPTSDGTVQRAVFTVGGATGSPSEPDAPAEPDEDALGACRIGS